MPEHADVPACILMTLQFIFIAQMFWFFSFLLVSLIPKPAFANLVSSKVVLDYDFQHGGAGWGWREL